MAGGARCRRGRLLVLVAVVQIRFVVVLVNHLVMAVLVGMPGIAGQIWVGVVVVAVVVAVGVGVHDGLVAVAVAVFVQGQQTDRDDHERGADNLHGEDGLREDQPGHAHTEEGVHLHVVDAARAAVRPGEAVGGAIERAVRIPQPGSAAVLTSSSSASACGAGGRSAHACAAASSAGHLTAFACATSAAMRGLRRIGDAETFCTPEER